MKISEAAQQLGCSVLFLREWIATGRCPFGAMVNISGGKRRTFYINEEAFRKYLRGETVIQIIKEATT